MAALFGLPCMLCIVTHINRHRDNADYCYGRGSVVCVLVTPVSSTETSEPQMSQFRFDSLVWVQGTMYQTGGRSLNGGHAIDTHWTVDTLPTVSWTSNVLFKAISHSDRDATGATNSLRRSPLKGQGQTSVFTAVTFRQ